MKKAPKTPKNALRTPDRTNEGLLKSPITPIITPIKKNNNKKRRSPKHYKTVYLIRHGESLGQVAPRQARQTDESLTDCGLTPKGIHQAKHLPKLLGPEQYEKIELVVSSPLLRAILTSLCGFGRDKAILVHYHCREIGSMIPENIPRSTQQVVRTLKEQQHEYIMDHNTEDILSNIDFESLRPELWPQRHDEIPKVLRRDRIRDMLFWLATQRPEQCIAIVCHYHVIRAALQDFNVQPTNGTYLECRLCTETGELTLGECDQI